jgi:hypothetical protein
MKERGLLLKGDMVRAVLDGRKTQTRRVIKMTDMELKSYNSTHTAIVDGEAVFSATLGYENHCPPLRLTSPLGKVGDRLYCRETFRIVHVYRKNHTYNYHRIGVQYKNGRDGMVDTTDDLQREQAIRFYDKSMNKKWNPSIHMPKWASRIWLEITAVRVERVQDISGEDVLKEGINPPIPDGCELTERPPDFDDWNSTRQEEWFETQARATYMSRCADVENCFKEFEDLWQSLYPGSWERSDWVWVYEFKAVKG